MESGDLIISNQLPININRRRITLKKRMSKEKMKDLVNQYIEANFKNWFKENTKILEKSFENIEEDEQGICYENYNEEMLECFDLFINILTNNWTATEYNFYKHFEDELDNVLIKDFIKLWVECSVWLEEDFRLDKTSLDNEEQAWNTICYWIFIDKLNDSWEGTFDFEYREQFEEYKDKTNKKSRILCGVCYENRILYTGCFKCNNNYLCRGCYYYLESENECPFCRHDKMITSINDITGISAMSPELFHHSIHLEFILKDLVREVKNEVIDNCECCKKEVRWKDRAKLVEEEEGTEYNTIIQEMLVCIPCYKKRTTIEGYKSLDESIPKGQEGQDFQDWIYKTIPLLHRIKREWDLSHKKECDCVINGYIFCPNCSK